VVYDNPIQGLMITSFCSKYVVYSKTQDELAEHILFEINSETHSLRRLVHFPPSTTIALSNIGSLYPPKVSTIAVATLKNQVFVYEVKDQYLKVPFLLHHWICEGPILAKESGVQIYSSKVAIKVQKFVEIYDLRTGKRMNSLSSPDLKSEKEDWKFFWNGEGIFFLHRTGVHYVSFIEYDMKLVNKRFHV